MTLPKTLLIRTISQQYRCQVQFSAPESMTITLSQPASRIWGARQSQGVDSRFHADMRRLMRESIQWHMNQLGCTHCEIYATGKGVWKVDEITYTPEPERDIASYRLKTMEEDAAEFAV